MIVVVWFIFFQNCPFQITILLDFSLSRYFDLRVLHVVLFFEKWILFYTLYVPD